MVKVLCYNSEGHSFDPSWFQWIFHWHKIILIALWPWKILPIALWLWGRLSLQQKWVPGVFPGGKGGRCVRHQYPVPLSRNLRTLTSWNLLGLSRPVLGLLYLSLLYSVYQHKRAWSEFSTIWRSKLWVVAKYRRLIITEFAEMNVRITGSVHIVGNEHYCKKII